MMKIKFDGLIVFLFAALLACPPTCSRGASSPAAGRSVSLRDVVIRFSATDEGVLVYRRGKLVQVLKRSVSVAPVFKMEDFDGDAEGDLMILRDRGIEEYYDIYIYRRGKYEKSNALSALPCPSVEDSGEIRASCFNNGGCERWEEYYKYKYDRLELRRRDGFTCDPTTGSVYKFMEEYSHGELISSKSEKAESH